MRRAIGLAAASFLAVSALLPCPVQGQELVVATLDPGHFHAALFQQEMLPGVAEECYVYAPLGPDLTAHLNRVAAFNGRSRNPTDWRLRIYAGSGFLDGMLSENRAQVVVMSGRNREKIDRLLRCVQAGMHVLADKPWIIEATELPKLQEALATAESRGIVAFDAMTQRFEITALIQRALVNDPDVFGARLPGTLAEPAVSISSLHYLCKEAAGQPNLRPPWFFDITEQGEGLADVGTHLVDMVHWILFPEDALSAERDVQLLRAARWPTHLHLKEYQRVTGESFFPSGASVTNGGSNLVYFCNNALDYTVRGLHVRVQTTWDFAALRGQKDTEEVIFRGSRARVEVRQDAEDAFVRQVDVVPASDSVRPIARAAIQARLAALQKDWPGLACEDQGARFRIIIPDRLRVGHEAHFAALTRQFLHYVRQPSRLPSWENANLIAKYYVTTRGVDLARQSEKAR
jgi:predicted dehydrogenase